MDIAEYVTTLQECSTVLSINSDSEFKAMDDIHTIWAQRIKSQLAEREAIKESIEAFAKGCGEAEDGLCELQTTDESERIQELSAQLDDYKKRKSAAISDLDKLRQEKETVTEQTEELRKKQEELRDSTTKIIPAIRHDLNIYQHITGIKWQYDCQPNEVKGYISHRNKVKTFSLDRQKNSQFFIANYLWGQMEPDW